MQTAAIVMLCLFGGVFLTVITGGMVAIGFFLHRIQRMLQAIERRDQESFESISKIINDFSVSVQAILEASDEHLQDTVDEAKNVSESAKSSMNGLRQEMRQTLANNLEESRKTLEFHHASMKEVVGKINGEALVSASLRAQEAFKKMEQLMTALHRMLLDHGEHEENNYGPEEFAPDGESIYAQSSVAKGDREAELEEFQTTLPLR
jgi:hypothetical protein